MAQGTRAGHSVSVAYEPPPVGRYVPCDSRSRCSTAGEAPARPRGAGSLAGQEEVKGWCEMSDAKNGKSAEDGILIRTLAELPPGALLDEGELARTFKAARRTIRNMVARRELPPPFRLRGRAFWFAGKVQRHIEAVADRLARQAVRDAARIDSAESGAPPS